MRSIRFKILLIGAVSTILMMTTAIIVSYFLYYKGARQQFLKKVDNAIEQVTYDLGRDDINSELTDHPILKQKGGHDTALSLYQSLLKRSLVYTLSATSPSTLSSNLLAIITSLCALNSSRSLTTLLRKNSLPSSRVGS